MIVRDFKKHDVTEDELRILLSFVEEDIHDYQRQSTAFPLLKVRGVCEGEGECSLESEMFCLGIGHPRAKIGRHGDI